MSGASLSSAATTPTRYRIPTLRPIENAASAEPEQNTKVDPQSTTATASATTTTNTTTSTTTSAEDNTTSQSGHHQHAHAKPRNKYRHVAAYHSQSRESCLSGGTGKTTDVLGFRNLMVLVLVVMNLRLIVENYMKYGVLICIRCHDVRRRDIQLGIILYALVPCHLFVAYLIELLAAQQVKGAVGRRKRESTKAVSLIEQSTFQLAWLYVALAHSVNASLCLGVTTYAVYWHIHHPAIGTVCQIHAIIVWLKNCSYAFTNRDLRHAVLYPPNSSAPAVPELYKSCPYPYNISVRNLVYFWFAPTLVYQPVYPRTSRVRRSFVAKRLVEVFCLSVIMWLLSAQYASPLLINSVETLAELNIPSILERIMKLSTISLVIWLCGFLAIFQSFLNALAELLRFGDREFYEDWWNSASLGTYWRTWNKPVYLFMRRHIYSPLAGRGWSPRAAGFMVFLFSAVMHEVLVGVPTHNIIGVAFMGMMVQLPLVLLTSPFERVKGKNGRLIGNCIFWITFCLVGQPLGALLYFFAWQAKYGTVSRGLSGS